MWRRLRNTLSWQLIKVRRLVNTSLELAEHDHGVKTDLVKAAEYCRLAANQGFVNG
jgi:hypothetical protein